MQNGSSEPYDEQTFRYLLDVEQRRSDRSGRPFVLVLVHAEAKRDSEARIDPEVATTIFSGLSRCLRETDFFGWYEDGRRAGAVLTELGDTARSDISKSLIENVMTRGLLEQLSPDVVGMLRIEVCPYPGADREAKAARRDEPQRARYESHGPTRPS